MADTMFDMMFAAALAGDGDSGFTPTEEQLTAMNSGITATDVEQINTNKTNISLKQDIIDSSHKLNADLVDDSNSTNKFATAAQLSQIETNRTNISLIKQVPSVNNSDNGKVLTASYNLNTGSYSWATPSVSAANVSGLANVATSGAYSDLSGTPTIPTVPITEIQKNGTAISPVSGVVNIAVPTTAADISALSSSTKYAGASTAGGSATSAAKLDNSTDAGSVTQPVYFSNGVPTATTYSLAKSVPSNAVFTDTTYGYASQSTAGLVRCWTTTDGSDTILHIATVAP